MTLALASIAASLLALGGCVLIRRFALRHALLDVPNERSLHKDPVPRLGGVAIAVSTWMVVGALALAGAAGRDVLTWLVVSLAVAGLGLVDDVRPLSASLRFLFQIGVATAFCLVVPLPPRVTLAGQLAFPLSRAASTGLSVLWIVAVLNIYNFMDGMDGLAGSQAVAAGVAIAVGLLLHGQPGLATVSLLVAAASTGFLLQNAPPARIFMGDMGSTFLGFSFAVLGLLGLRGADPVPFSVPALALAPFLVDGTFTILRRASRREPIWKAHRSHVYQRLVATGLGHRDVLIPYAGWMVLSAIAASAAAVPTGKTTGLLAGAVLVPFVLLWRWAVSRERAVPAREASG